MDRHYGSEMRLSRPVINDHVRLLGVTISSDLSPVKHVGTISSSCIYWLRQIRRIQRSLDAESEKTLVHAFITRARCRHHIPNGDVQVGHGPVHPVQSARDLGVYVDGGMTMRTHINHVQSLLYIIKKK